MVEHHSTMPRAERDAFSHWLSGFTDAEGCFQLGCKNRTAGLYPYARFDIALRRDDVAILKEIERFWGVGFVVEADNAGRDFIRYRVHDTASIATIIAPHFAAYPLYAKKRLDCEIWMQATRLLWGVRSTQPHRSVNGSCKWKSSEGEQFNGMVAKLRLQKKYDPDWRTGEPPPISRRYLVPGPERDAFGNWLAGFVDGEGCFYLGNQAVGGSPTAAFSIRLRSDDKPILLDIQRFLGVGRIDDLRPQDRCNPCSTYTVSKITELAAVVTPIFDEYPLRAKKRHDFRLWKEGVAIAASGQSRRGASQDAGGRITGGKPCWPGARSELDRFNEIRSALCEGRIYEHAERQPNSA